MPFLDNDPIAALKRSRNEELPATCFLSLDDSRPEPLCAIYEPSCFDRLAEAAKHRRYSLRGFLESRSIQGVVPSSNTTLQQVNSPDDYERARIKLASRSHA